MIELSAREIAHVTGGELVGADAAALTVGKATTDSRNVAAGDLFVAIAGDSADGHDYAAAAHAAGAALIVAEREVAVPHLRVASTVRALGDIARHVLTQLRETGDIRVVGVTGSAGKTTTKDLLHAALATAGPTVAPHASFNNDIGLPLTVLRCEKTTRFLVAEMGASAAGDLTRLTSIAPLDVAVVLMVGHAHVGGFGSIADVARAKSELVKDLRPGAQIVLNADDARVRAMAAAATYAGGAPIEPAAISYFSAAGDLRGERGLAAADVTTDALGRAAFSADGAYVQLPIPGTQHVNNALAALTACRVLGLDLAPCAAAMAGAALSPHRMALRAAADGVTILDDAYNANPESMRAALAALTALGASRKIALLGTMLEMGGQADAQHAEVGAFAASCGVDWLIACDADALAAGARAANPDLRVDAVSDRDAARQLLDAELADGDLLLIKGSNGAGLWALADELAEEHA